jgi:hypothetical protein
VGRALAVAAVVLVITIAVVALLPGVAGSPGGSPASAAPDTPVPVGTFGGLLLGTVGLLALLGRGK